MSAANLVHGAFRLMEIGGVDAVAWFFGADAVAEELDEVFVGAAAAQERAGVPLDGGE